MSVVDLPDEEFALLRRLLSALALNLDTPELLKQPGELFALYLAVFAYETISDGKTPDGRTSLAALVEDLKRIGRLLDRPSAS